MDFVVVGLGLGALAMLLGIALLAWAAPRQARLARAASRSEARRGLAIAANRRGAGVALLYAGGAIFLATIGGLAGALDDRTGAFLVATTTTVAALGLLVWGYLDHLRNPIPPPTRPRADAVVLESSRRSVTRPLIVAPDPATANGHGSEDRALSAPAAPVPAPVVAEALLAIAARSVTNSAAEAATPGIETAGAASKETGNGSVTSSAAGASPGEDREG
ncbi:MAG: hypothetical protein IT338_03155 [Thermomicrobiales bacterium]|nr:hypothetical protein [Thermomicrobiales bacterium]